MGRVRLNREEILFRMPLTTYMAHIGREVFKDTKSVKCLCPLHDDHHPSFDIDEKRGVWHCFPCDAGGCVIDLVMKMDGISSGKAMDKLTDLIAPAEDTLVEDDKSYYVATTYSYTDEHGQHKFYVDRYQRHDNPFEKTFRPYVKKLDRKVYGLKGVTRYLYLLPEVLATEDDVFIVEGEKAVNAMVGMDYVATTNPGGCGGWLASYSQWLEGKHVTIIPDNDDAGPKWLAKIKASLEGKVASLRIITLPDQYNDIADIVDELGSAEARDVLSGMLDVSARIERGVDLPILSAEEATALYRAECAKGDRGVVDISKIFPSLRDKVRPVTRGEVVMLMGPTGSGKSMLSQNISMTHSDLQVDYFSLELPAVELAERFFAIQQNMAAKVIEKLTSDGERIEPTDWRHIGICDQSGITVEQIEEYVTKRELKFGCQADLVIVDYIGLVGSDSSKRYERLSDAAEAFKVMAKRTNTVVLIVSQVHRSEKNKDGTIKVQEPSLYSAKDSGSLENSAQLVLGIWRDDDKMMIRVLKATKGGAGTLVTANVHGGTMRITEKAFVPDHGCGDPEA